ncbi:MAG: metallopeptidase family protein [Meiothermus silvanus]|uniref:metallopeptidase family protein n=1 Tax=Allomeiothermus silvanus TaxID=52022 RepID=UPI00235519BC|nr:metallopeptidase family protein [Allomeiothermus silvanus]MBI5813359.1 metallopeptidase family protein [Allomeiothermus silvanus]MCL6568561.1 metallopeptidase family protein [Allomeiothermus silvanus]
MTFSEFHDTAYRLWSQIPEAFKRGLHGMHVLENPKRDPNEPELFWLGEYLSPGYPTVLGGFEGLGRHIALYYGSFHAVAYPGFDWEGEIWETLLHELRHHLEFLAGRDDLVAEDLEYLRRYREGKRRRPTTE